MAIILNEEEKEKVKSGELSINDIIKLRGQTPDAAPPPMPKSELEKVKEELKAMNVTYRENIEENRRLREAVKQNVLDKAKCREEIARLREKKKQLMK